jgi:hypothetical protein
MLVEKEIWACNVSRRRIEHWLRSWKGDDELRRTKEKCTRCKLQKEGATSRSALLKQGERGNAWKAFENEAHEEVAILSNFASGFAS